MSDTEYVNSYLENSIGMLHDYLNQVLQVKTQLKIVTDSVTRKNAEIDSLTSQLEFAKTELQNARDNFQQELDTNRNALQETGETINKTREENRRLEEEHAALTNKLSEFETLTKQFAELKKQFKDKDSENEKLRLIIQDLKNPKKDAKPATTTAPTPAPIAPVKKVLNTKTSAIDKANSVITENDDF